MVREAPREQGQVAGDGVALHQLRTYISQCRGHRMGR